MPFPKPEPISKLTHADLPPGTRVKIIAPVVDMMFFNGQTGVVTKNKGGYLGIIVKFDYPIYVRYTGSNKVVERVDHNFDPEHLEILEG